jgi:hypothetical protein
MLYIFLVLKSCNGKFTLIVNFSALLIKKSCGHLAILTSILHYSENVQMNIAKS